MTRPIQLDLLPEPEPEQVVCRTEAEVDELLQRLAKEGRLRPISWQWHPGKGWIFTIAPCPTHTQN